uniref:TPT domain-containing protein n=1 Tax=Syphacia muris TaxID=451379 RepID=A0A0N5AVP9_9BILA
MILSLIKMPLYISISHNAFFDFQNAILIMEASMTYVILETLRILDIIKLTPYNAKGFKLTILPTAVSAISAQLNAAFSSDRFAPMFTTIMRLCPLAILIIERTIKREHRSATSRLAFCVAVVSIAGALTSKLLKLMQKRLTS